MIACKMLAEANIARLKNTSDIIARQAHLTLDNFVKKAQNVAIHCFS